jgi:hypothetical protein
LRNQLRENPPGGPARDFGNWFGERALQRGFAEPVAEMLEEGVRGFLRVRYETVA